MLPLKMTESEIDYLDQQHIIMRVMDYDRIVRDDKMGNQEFISIH